jgi:predicted GNAT family N-acyltransferase
VSSPSEQDLVDLNKLLAEAPAEWLPTHSEDLATDYLQQARANNQKVAAGRFNDRLIATTLISSIDENDASLEIDQMLVRSITRDRGVAKQVLVRLTQLADQNGQTLIVKDPKHQYRTLLEFGFIYDNQTWQRTKRTV